MGLGDIIRNIRWRLVRTLDPTNYELFQELLPPTQYEVMRVLSRDPTSNEYDVFRALPKQSNDEIEKSLQILVELQYVRESPVEINGVKFGTHYMLNYPKLLEVQRALR